ncbi:late embryogenesis abundant protein 18-like [Cornus florida]|uniref:late embryogenesis abundant protein 18-like n=1 Tax=Cornus florida TaxID=4283 RepID=UPI0028988300|nr:late embryogenesis abundant protein 18-like [Cornus florida]
MYSAKEKVSNAASVAKEKVDKYKAKVEEKLKGFYSFDDALNKSTARTKEEEEIAHQERKAKEAEAEMRMHDAKFEHAAEKLQAKHTHHCLGVGGHSHTSTHAHYQPVGTVAPTTGTTAPVYPLRGQARYPHGQHKCM